MSNFKISNFNLINIFYFRMYLFLLFIFTNIFYYVTALSVHVKITWRDNPKGLQILANKTRNRFKVELTSNKWELPKEGETDKYDTFHFEDVEQNNDENLGKYSLKVYKVLNKNVCKFVVYHCTHKLDQRLNFFSRRGKNCVNVKGGGGGGRRLLYHSRGLHPFFLRDPRRRDIRFKIQNISFVLYMSTYLYMGSSRLNNFKLIFII